MLTLNITQVSRREVNTQYGTRTKVNFKCREYGNTWIGAWENDYTRTMQAGSQIQVQEVKQNGRYYDALFPKAQGGGGGGGRPPAGPAGGAAALPVLQNILNALLRIEKILANPGQMHVAKTELDPDDSFPGSDPAHQPPAPEEVPSRQFDDPPPDDIF